MPSKGSVLTSDFGRCRKNTLPRTFWMTCAHILMILSFILYASDLSGTLYVATTLLGICYGVQYSMMVPTVSELFGLKHFGMNYGFSLHVNRKSYWCSSFLSSCW